jgi:hypothetical protein
MLARDLAGEKAAAPFFRAAEHAYSELIFAKPCVVFQNP